MPAPKAIIDYIDANADQFIQRLAHAVGIPSVSGDASYRKDVFKMAEFLKGELEAIGVTVRLADLGKHVMDGQELPLPPAILGSIGNDKNKKTILLYAHYDVQPALKSDGWNTDPFTLTINKETGQLIGRGSSDDKGPLLGWINNLQAHHALGLELPVNIRLCFEGMEESGSEGLDELIEAEADKFFKGVDCVCISDNYWLNTRTPCLTYGLRGLTYFKIKVSGPSRDLHSGVFGGTVHEPMTDLVYIMSKLVTPGGKILIPGVDDLVEPLADAEKVRYETLDYGVADVESAAGGRIAISSEKAKVLMNRMRYPSLSLHGIEGAFSAPGAKTVIPASVSGKFSLRLVPFQTPDNINPLVEKYIKAEFAKLNSRNSLELECLHGGKPWVASPDHWNYRAAIKATEIVYNKTPDLTREGGSIPVTLTFAETLNVNVLLLPMGRGDDGAHSTNEKLDRSNYISGTKLLGTYLYEVATTQ
ncbi:CNDP dipeptidase [Hysterangium stoloniferum]|nr:CNDP dipeptidase [Hysterangium stoloniferum]